MNIEDLYLNLKYRLNNRFYNNGDLESILQFDSQYIYSNKIVILQYNNRS